MRGERTFADLELGRVLLLLAGHLAAASSSSCGIETRELEVGIEAIDEAEQTAAAGKKSQEV